MKHTVAELSPFGKMTVSSVILHLPKLPIH